MSSFERELDHLAAQNLYNELARSCGPQRDYNLSLRYGRNGKFVVRFERAYLESRAMEKAQRVMQKLGRATFFSSRHVQKITSFRSFSKLPSEIQTMIIQKVRPSEKLPRTYPIVSRSNPQLGCLLSLRLVNRNLKAIADSEIKRIRFTKNGETRIEITTDGQISLVLQNSSLIFQMKPKVLLPISTDIISNAIQFIRFTESSKIFIYLRHQLTKNWLLITEKMYELTIKIAEIVSQSELKQLFGPQNSSNLHHFSTFAILLFNLHDFDAKKDVRFSLIP